VNAPAQGGHGDEDAENQQQIERDLPGPLAQQAAREVALALVSGLADPAGVGFERGDERARRGPIEPPDDGIRRAQQVRRAERGQRGDGDGDG